MGDNRLENVKQLVWLQQNAFKTIAASHNAVDFTREALFAMQILGGNEYLCNVAMTNQDSLKHAILNVAAIGLSLNPAEPRAYLVPRKNKVCLDISYMGYKQLYEDTGAVQWVRAEIHYQKDVFEWHSFNRQPAHKFDPSEDRGEIKGCYVCAKLANDDIMSTYMKISDIYKIRDIYSESWKGKNRSFSPWSTNPLEMIKKTVIRYARKDWPAGKNKSDVRLEAVERVTQESEPVSLNPGISAKEFAERTDLILKIRGGLEILGEDEKTRIALCARAYGNPDLKEFEEMTIQNLKQALRMIKSEIDEKAVKT